MQVEKERVAVRHGNSRNGAYSRVLWLVVTVSQHLKIWMKEQYGTSNERTITVTNRSDHFGDPYARYHLGKFSPLNLGGHIRNHG